jgi:hypothetical protein
MKRTTPHRHIIRRLLTKTDFFNTLGRLYDSIDWSRDPRILARFAVAAAQRPARGDEAVLSQGLAPCATRG